MNFLLKSIKMSKLSLLWKHVEILIVALLVIIDFSIRTHHFKTIQHTNSTEWPHNIKHFLTPMTGNYIQEPISKVLYNLFFANINANKHDLANFITLTYTLISIPTIWLLSKVERKYYLCRQFGCLIFQIKNVMDYLDGAVIRNGKTKNYDINGYQVDNGQIIDATANGISTFCFFIGTFFYIIIKYSKKSNSMIVEDSEDDCKLANDIKKYDRLSLVVYILMFLIYFVISSLGWNIVLEIYTKEVIYNQV